LVMKKVMSGNCGGGCCACKPPTNANAAAVAASAAAVMFLCIHTSRALFTGCESGRAAATAQFTSAWDRRSECRQRLHDPLLRPGPTAGTLIGAHGAQHEMVSARRADELDADRQAGLG